MPAVCGAACISATTRRSRVGSRRIRVRPKPSGCARSDDVGEGGTAGAVLNAANEAAVASFLAGELAFTEIVPACRGVLEQHHFESQPTLERLFELDCWAREEVGRWVCT